MDRQYFWHYPNVLDCVQVALVIEVPKEPHYNLCLKGSNGPEDDIRRSLEYLCSSYSILIICVNGKLIIHYIV